MSRLYLLFFTALIFFNIGAAQSVLQSDYLTHPSKNIDYVLGEAEFWSHARDSVNGGFFSYLNRDATQITDSLKSLPGNSRLAFAFSRAFMLTGNTDYLDYACHALDFLYTHGWDTTNGGWYFTTDAAGMLQAWNQWWDPNTWKWSFTQHYALVGIAPVVEATGGVHAGAYPPDYEAPVDSLSHWDWMMRGFDMLDAQMWDHRPEYAGYFADADLDWSNARGKGFTPTVDGVTTNALILYLLTKEDMFRDRLLTMADIMDERLVASMDNPQVKFGFAEEYDSDWNLNTESAGGSVGHVLKTAWCLARAYMVEPREAYRDAAQRLILDMWENGGFDHVHGGPLMGYNWKTGEVDAGKDYWMVEQAVMCGLINYYIAESDSMRRLCLQMADESIDFYMNYLRDDVYGGSFSQTRVEGEVTNDTKGDIWKNGYHGVELGYLTYLYTNLYVHQQPVQLYYHFEAAERQRIVELYPLAIPDQHLKITAVEREGQDWPQYDRDARSITLPADSGGTFCVTFENTGAPLFVADEPNTIDRLRLQPAFPNPFNHATRIEFHLPKQMQVQLAVYNTLGQQVRHLDYGRMASGVHAVTLNAADFSSGVYFYQLQADQQVRTGKLTLIK
ncbi:MAG: AGE family epimerase/isomerase [candidate division KSB1 bacterium]|nr:AGE family epimerase/isomerase [candidate division KSB1 bacterium]